MWWNIGFCGELGLMIIGTVWIICILRKRKDINESSLKERLKEPKEENGNKNSDAFEKISTPENKTRTGDKTEKPESEKNHKNFLKKFFSHCSSYWILGIVILLIGFDIAIHIPIIDIKCSYFGAIIGFVGVLATFIVVSNYAQVRDVERKTNKTIKDTEKKFKEELNEIKNEFNRKISNTEIGLNKKIDMEHINTEESLYINSVDTALVSGDLKTMLTSYIHLISYAALNCLRNCKFDNGLISYIDTNDLQKRVDAAKNIISIIKKTNYKMTIDENNKKWHLSMLSGIRNILNVDDIVQFIENISLEND
jgi:hypothetical protein